MQLLVSVSNEAEACAAREGGADIIDAKDPHAGALGAVSLETFRRIQSIGSTTRPVSAALGDATDEGTIERLAHEYATAGAAFVKIGFAGIEDVSRVRSLITSAIAGARRAGPRVHRAGPLGPAVGVVAVAYADSMPSTLTLDTVLDTASMAGASGVLVDTAHKTGPGLRSLIDGDTLARWISRAHDAGLTAAVAGKLTIDDLEWARDSGADIAGVRGAACENGRTSRITVDRVRQLRAAVAVRLAQV